MIFRMGLSTKLWSMPPEKKNPIMENSRKRENKPSNTLRTTRARCPLSCSAMVASVVARFLGMVVLRLVFLFIGVFFSTCKNTKNNHYLYRKRLMLLLGVFSNSSAYNS